MSIADNTLMDQLEKFTAWLVKPKAAKLGWEAKADESYFDSLLRPRLLAPAGRCGDEATVAEAQRRFAVRATSPIAADLRGTVYMTVARFGSTKEYDELYAMYKATDLQEEQRRLVAALGGFVQEDLLKRTLAMALSSDVRVQDSIMVIMCVLGSRYGHELGWQYIQDNWAELVKRYGQGGPLLSYVPQGVGGAFNTHAKAAEVKAFFDAHPNPGIERGTKQAFERITHKANWAERDSGKINKFLGEFKY